jgi:hypothetical protein
MLKKIGAISFFFFYLTFISFSQKPGSLTAVEFDGVDDFISIPDITAINPTTKITVEAWIKADAFSTTNFGNSILCKHGWASGNKGYVLRCGDNGKVNFNIANSSGVWVEAVSASVMKTGMWYHVAGTFNGDSVSVYINGNLEASVPYSGSISPSTGLAAKIGDLAYTTGGSRLFKGQIDEVRVWNAALTKTTIRDWMCRKVITLHPNYGNLGAYYKLDEGTGINASDKSSNANTAALNNSPRWVSSGAALGDSSVYVYGANKLSLKTKYHDVFNVNNINGAPSTLHAIVNYDYNPSFYGKNVAGTFDSSHYFTVYYSDNSAVGFDINYNFTNLAKTKGAKKCGVDMLAKPLGNGGTWNYTPSKFYDIGDSLVIKKQTKNEFVMNLFQTDSTKLLITAFNKDWFCGGDSLLITAQGNDSFTYVWYKNGGILAGKTNRTMWASSVGNYKVKLTRKGTSCSFTTSQMAVNSRSTSVTWNSSITTCENSDSIKLSQGTPSGGYFTGKGVTSNGYFHPKNLGAGNFAIFYNYVDTNSCINRASITAKILDTAKLTVTPISSICTGAISFTLNNITPTGGKYSGKGVSSTTFNPITAGEGSHKITYLMTKANTCVSKANFNINIYKPDSISITLKDKACNFDEPIAINTYPAGGVLKGSAVVGQNFYPLFASKGWQWVYYSITDAHLCDVKDSARIYISEAPKVSFSKLSSLCDNTADITLTGGQPADSGTYWVNNVQSSKFSPSAKGKGVYKIEYRVVNYFGCRDSVSATLRVNASPVKPGISVNKNILSSSSAAGNQWLDKNGPITGANQQDFNPPKDGFYFVKVTNDSNCSATSDSFQFAKVGISNPIFKDVSVYPNPSASGIFTIKGLPAQAEIRVVDLLGKELIYHNSNPSNTRIDLSEYGMGTYFILIKSQNQWYNIRVVVLQ